MRTAIIASGAFLFLLPTIQYFLQTHRDSDHDADFAHWLAGLSLDQILLQSVAVSTGMLLLNAGALMPG